MLMNPLQDMTKLAEDLKEVVYDEPVEVKKELAKNLKPAIKLGNEHGKSTKPEKRLYKKLKKIDASSEREKLEQALDEWVEEINDERNE